MVVLGRTYYQQRRCAMSSLVQKSAYFLMETGESGRIFFANGDTSFDILSKEEANYVLRTAIKSNLIDTAEKSIIEQQIDNSPLPAKLSETMEQLLAIKATAQEIYRLCNEEFGGLPSDTFSSKDGATPDDTAAHIPGNRTTH